jgi:L-methionine (R)-S-oxide reductase
MAEVTPDLRGIPKERAYAQLYAHAIAVLAGIDDDIAGMATISALVHHGFGHLWTGFYRVVGANALRVGPYQGAVGCLDIAFGRGVCGTAAASRKTLVVPDVERFPGHISCDGRSRSETRPARSSQYSTSTRTSARHSIRRTPLAWKTSCAGSPGTVAVDVPSPYA